MATFDIDDLFTQYYTLYRAEATIPTDTSGSEDDEYTIFLRLVKEAIQHWATYDNTYWKELYTTLQLDGTGATKTITTGTTTYTAPTNMQEAGGFVRVLDSNSNTLQIYPIIEPQEVQFKGDDTTYAYFTGNPTNGFTLHLNPSPTSTLNGLSMDYVYYKKPTFPTATTDKPEMGDPMFVVHRALANRFRASRNPFYEDALRDSENALTKMKMRNESGTWSNPWKVEDRSGSIWGS